MVYMVSDRHQLYTKDTRGGLRLYILLSVLSVPGGRWAVGSLLCFQSQVIARHFFIRGLEAVCDLGQEVCLFPRCRPGHNEALSTWTQQVRGGYRNNNNNNNDKNIYIFQATA